MFHIKMRRKDGHCLDVMCRQNKRKNQSRCRWEVVMDGWMDILMDPGTQFVQEVESSFRLSTSPIVIAVSLHTPWAGLHQFSLWKTQHPYKTLVVMYVIYITTNSTGYTLLWVIKRTINTSWIKGLPAKETMYRTK